MAGENGVLILYLTILVLVTLIAAVGGSVRSTENFMEEISMPPELRKLVDGLDPAKMMKKKPEGFAQYDGDVPQVRDPSEPEPYCAASAGAGAIAQ